jgi:hypothetical protein
VDFVYVVRHSEDNEELRYSLRSLERNAPVGRVWIVGYKPSWLHGVEYLPTNQSRSKWENSTANLLTACLHDDVAERFVYMNDDFHVVRPIDEVETLHRGPVRAVLGSHYRYRSGTYLTGMRMTARLLHSLGYADPISYELHVPMVLERRKMVEALHVAAEHRSAYGMTALHKRTLYGNLHGIGGRAIADVKVNNSTRRAVFDSVPYVSTSKQAWSGQLGRLLRSMFPEPSSYERRSLGR